MTLIAETTELTFDQPFVLVCAFIVGTLGVTRVTRLIVDDDYPPVLWMTERIERRLPQHWRVLFRCPWCASPYIALIDLIWAWASGLHWTWWFGNVWAAASWLAGFLTVRDIPPDQRE